MTEPIEQLLHVLPSFLLLATLIRGRYVGERRLHAIRQRRHRPRRVRRVPALPTNPGKPRDAMPRGGLLVAWSIAVRPPPRAALA